MNKRFWEYFVKEDDEEDYQEDKARQIIEFEGIPYYRDFRSYLISEIQAPLKVSDHASMIQSAVRANTFKEILAKIERDITLAKSILDRAGKL